MSRNPTLLRCPACGSELKYFLEGRARLVAFAIWMVGITLIVPVEMPFGWALLFVLLLGIPWTVAERRVYRAWWLRRHPARCQGDGHAAPLPEGGGA